MQVFLALIFVLALIGVIAILTQRFKKVAFWNRMGNQKLRVKEVLNLDIKKKLLIVEYNNKSYMLLLGNNDIVVDILDNDTKPEEHEIKQISPTLY